MKINDHPEDPRITSGKNISSWIDTVHRPAENPLRENLETDVVIIGGGLAGLSTAYCLTEAGLKIVLVEDGLIGSGETGRTTAQLVTALDDRYTQLAKTFGEKDTWLIADSHRAAIDFVEHTIRKENIACDFARVNGYLFRHPSDKKNSLEEEFNSALKAGVEVMETEVAPGMLKKEKALCFLNQAQFHPLKYLVGLYKAIERNGGKIFTGTHAKEINHEGIRTERGFRVKAKHVVVATNSPVNNRVAMFEKIYAYRTYVIGALIPKGSLPQAFWWDTGDHDVNHRVAPYHYVRIQEYNDEHDLLLSGGEDHPTGDTHKTHVAEEDRYRALENWTREYFNMGEVVYRWSGQILEPMDGISFIGHNPFDKKNVYIITGDSGNGMTHCTFAGMMLTDMITGKKNRWEKIYRPTRFTLKKSAPILEQMGKELGSYMKQLPNFNGTGILDSIKPGEGKVVSMKEEKFGVYRDEQGEPHIVSAECTHLKCTVAWNAEELSWDCPCHGSRFTYDGKAINGPANFDLPRYTEDVEPVEAPHEERS